MVGGEAPTWEDAKKFPPSWSNQERWNKIMDIYKVDLEFAKRSPAGKMNRQKLQIISTSGSKSHNDVRLELNKQLKRDATFDEWWKKTHMCKGTDGGNGIWASEFGREIMEAYMEMMVEKYPDDADRPTFDVMLLDKVIKSRSVGSASRKQALDDLYPRFAESSCSVKGPVTHAIGSSQSSNLPNYVTHAILNDQMT